MSDNHLLVTVRELAEQIGNPDWVAVDCRFALADTGYGEAAYLGGHIPDARYAHLDRDLSGSLTPLTGRHPLPDVDRLKEWLGRAGIDNDKSVIVYDDAGGSMAVRLWWLLRWLGHDRVALLDGGWQAWEEAGLPVHTSAPEIQSTSFSGAEIPAMVVDAEDLYPVSERERLIDVRTSERFNAEAEPIDPVAGHIPGATNVPWPDHLDGQGRFLAPDRLREIYERATDGDLDNRILMCGSGVTACLGIFALELAGVSGARLYAGSWSEWIRDPSRPVATGPS